MNEHAWDLYKIDRTIFVLFIPLCRFLSLGVMDPGVDWQKKEVSINELQEIYKSWKKLHEEFMSIDMYFFWEEAT